MGRSGIVIMHDEYRYKIRNINASHEHRKLESKLGNKIIPLDRLKESTIYNDGVYLMLNIMEEDLSYLVLYYNKTVDMGKTLFNELPDTEFYFKILKFIGTGYQKYVYKQEDIPSICKLVTFDSKDYLKEWYCYYLTSRY